MAIGLIGRKCGMTRVFTEDGASLPVTVIEVEPNRVTQLKSIESDGYVAVQVTTGSRRKSRLNKPAVGHYTKASTYAGRGLWEFRPEEADDEYFSSLKLGDEIVDPEKGVVLVKGAVPGAPGGNVVILPAVKESA